jgi:hypothetical protein
VSFGTDQLLEGYNDMKKGYKGTKKLWQINGDMTLKP